MAQSVLVIDDSDTVRGVLRGMLEELSVSVVDASSGHAGLQVLRTTSGIGLVFLDMNMPGLGGLEVLREIRADAALAELPVVVLTGEGGLDGLEEARGLEAAGWLQKPTSIKALEAIVRRYLPDTP